MTSQDLEMTCPKVDEPDLPEGGFMDQVVLNCTNDNLYGKIFYTCIAGTWIIKEECRMYYWEMNNHSRMQIWDWWVWFPLVGSEGEQNRDHRNFDRPYQAFLSSFGLGWLWRFERFSYLSLLPFWFLACAATLDFPSIPRGDFINVCQGVGTEKMLCDMTGKWTKVNGDCCTFWLLWFDFGGNR